MAQDTTSLPVHSHGHALIVVNALHAAGIPATIADSHINNVYPGLDFGALRPRILVPPSHEAQAREIIAQAHSADAVPLYPCPKCGGETKLRSWPMLKSLRLALTGRFDEWLNPPRYCGTCDNYDSTPPPEPFTADELGYPPIR